MFWLMGRRDVGQRQIGRNDRCTLPLQRFVFQR